MTEQPRTFRTKAAGIFTSPIFIIITLVITGALMTIYGSIGYLSGLGMAIITFWAVRWNGSWFGIKRPKWGRTLMQSLIYTLVIILLVDVIITPAIEMLTEPLDYSGFEWLRGNFAGLLVFTLIMWIMAAFGEELFYRGYAMKQLAGIFGDSNFSWIIAAFLSSAMFGIVHLYQGISGVLSTGIVGLILATVFMKNRNNLILCMLIHGIYDMWGLTLIYLSKDRVITDWVQQNLFQF